MTSKLIQEMREQFEKRYGKSDIYWHMHADWFPNDVMQFIEREMNKAYSLGKQEVIDLIRSKEIEI